MSVAALVIAFVLMWGGFALRLDAADRTRADRHRRMLGTLERHRANPLADEAEEWLCDT